MSFMSVETMTRFSAFPSFLYEVYLDFAAICTSGNVQFSQYDFGA